MQNNFREFEELVFFDLWIPVSGFRFPDSSFRFQLLGLPGQVTIQNWVGKSVGREGLLSVLCDKPCGTLWVSS